MSDYSIVNFDGDLRLDKFDGIKWRIFVSANDAFFLADDIGGPFVIMQELSDTYNCSSFVSFFFCWVVFSEADVCTRDDKVKRSVFGTSSNDSVTRLRIGTFYIIHEESLVFTIETVHERFYYCIFCEEFPKFLERIGMMDKRNDWIQ